jgi:hypothetical protein
MSRFTRRRPSPSMVVAFIALCVALAGTATALPGRNRVKKDDIARAAVRSKHIKAGAILSKHIKSRAVTRSKIAKRAVGSDQVGQDALTGQNIVESSLATVPSATNAGTVNGRSVEKMSFFAGAGAPATNVLSLKGLTIIAACNAGPALSVSATTAVSNSFIHAGGPHTASGSYYNGDDSFNIGDSFNVIDNAGSVSGSTNVEGTLTYARTDGEVVTATFLAQETAGGCVFAGTAIG